MSNGINRPRLRRTWPQRLTIVAAIGLSVVSFAVAGLVWFAQQKLEERQFVVLDDLSPSELDPLSVEEVTDRATRIVPPETFPPAEPSARNILATGADNRSCIDPNSRFAPAFDDRGGLSERSDTIMMWRINPSASAAAVLSFPRDLWVDIDGRSRPDRINAGYVRNDPQRLINTIYQNFGIETDHFVQIDFCAFKTLVDAIGGVAVPFDFPVRDVKTGLFVPEPGCFTFDGDHGLAYVRSRKMEYLDEEGRWQRDGTSDLGRISRQQDFLERVVDELIANVFSPAILRSLFETNREFVVTDDQLTIDRLLEFAGVIQHLDSTLITTYQIETSPRVIGNNAVLIPRTDGQNMQAVLAIFQGRAILADTVDQEDFIGTNEATTAPPTPDATIPAVTTATTIEPTAFEAVEVDAEETVFGIVPTGTIRCR